MFLLRGFLEVGSAFEAFELVLETSFDGFFFETLHDFLHHLRLAMQNRHGKSFALVIDEHAVIAEFGVAGFAEMLTCKLHIEGSRFDGWIADQREAFAEDVEALEIAAQIEVDDFLVVRGVAEAEAHFFVVQRRHGEVQPEAGVGAGPDVVVLGLMDVALVHLGDLQLLIPVFRDAHHELFHVDLALAEELQHFFLQTHHAVNDVIDVEAVAVELLVPRPPVFHAGKRHAAAKLNVFLANDIRARTRTAAPLIALLKVRPELAVKAAGERRGAHIIRRERFGLRERDGERARIVTSDVGVVRAIPLVAEGVLRILAELHVELVEEIICFNGRAVREGRIRVDAEVNGAIVRRNGPLLGHTRNHPARFWMQIDERHLHVVVMITAKGTVAVLAKNAQRRREGEDVEPHGAALLRIGVADLRLGCAVFPLQISRNVFRLCEGEVLRLFQPLAHFDQFGLQLCFLGRIGLFGDLRWKLLLLALQTLQHLFVIEAPKGLALLSAVIRWKIGGGEG